MPLTLTFDIKTLHQIMPTFLYIQKKKKKNCMCYLTDGECSLRVNCEFCQVDTELYNIEG